MKFKFVSVKKTLGSACLAGLILSFTINGAVFGQTQPQRPGSTPRLK